MDKCAALDVTVSVISHGHGEHVIRLISRLEALCTLNVAKVVLTINIPETSLLAQINAKRWSFRLAIVQNTMPAGYGANHNEAFEHCKTSYFCVLNPDIDFEVNPFPALISRFDQTAAGCAFPLQFDKSGQLQDYARKVPSLAALITRYLGPAVELPLRVKPDWVNGAFMLFKADVFRQLNGFDERYFMYCEDVDICLRLQLAGYSLAQAEAEVTHIAHRSSRGSFRHLAWHVVSLLRLWSSSAYRKFSRSH